MPAGISKWPGKQAHAGDDKAACAQVASAVVTDSMGLLLATERADQMASRFHSGIIPAGLPDIEVTLCQEPLPSTIRAAKAAGQTLSHESDICCRPKWIVSPQAITTLLAVGLTLAAGIRLSLRLGKCLGDRRLPWRTRRGPHLLRHGRGSQPQDQH